MKIGRFAEETRYMRYHCIRHLILFFLAGLLVGCSASTADTAHQNSSKGTPKLGHPRLSKTVNLAKFHKVSGRARYLLEYVSAGAPVYLIKPHPAALAEQAGQPVTVAGWAIDPSTHSGSGGVVVSVDGKRSYEARYGISRPDVARHFHDRRYRWSGFVAIIPADLALGRHYLRIIIIRKGGKAYYTPGPKTSFFVYRRVSLDALHRETKATDGFVEYVDAERHFNVRLRSSRPTVPAGQLISVGGWAVDIRAHARAGAVVVTIPGFGNFEAGYGDRRPDVARALRSSAYLRSGFHVLLPTRGLSKGSHYLVGEVVSRDHKTFYVLGQHVTFVVR